MENHNHNPNPNLNPNLNPNPSLNPIPYPKPRLGELGLGEMGRHPCHTATPINRFISHF